MSLNQQGTKGPFKGYQDDMPPPHLPDEAWSNVVNYLCRRGKMNTRPQLTFYGPSLNPTPDGALIRNMRTFIDAGQNLHTVALTTQNAYAITAPNGYNRLALPSLASLAGTGLPYGNIVTQNRWFFSNGSVKVLYADGENTLKDANAPGSCRFLTVNASTLIGAYWTEPAPGLTGSTLLPQRVRWATSGNPTVWTGFTSGFEDLLDVPDFITGLTTVGFNTLIFRPNGFSIMYATSNGAAPFGFEHVSTDDIQTGLPFPYTLARLGQQAVFVSSYDIHTINSGLQIQSIGGHARTKIFKQLGNASKDIPVGFTVSQLAPGVPFLSYWLCIPGQSVWVYSFLDDSWQEFSSQAGIPTFIGQVVLP